ncbi:MAG: ParB/RepB/Spo0J family partition protein [Candidatus Sericytochromatia bacterium]|nr:ParB/RepB/Spo0J family partition protein [Candidatus Sericytochromatia bacterium]
MTTTPPPTRGSFAALYEASRSLSHDVAPRQLRLSQLEPNPQQPRTQFPTGSIEELAASIRVHGLLQPILVRPHPHLGNGRYEIVAGERRFHACRLAGLEAVPVVIRQLDDATARQAALIENLQRENITPLEEAVVLKQILDETGLSHREVGERIGKSKAYVEQRVRLLRYPEEVRTALTRRPDPEGATFGPGHARAVVQLQDAAARQALIAEIERKGLTVREAERRVQRALQAPARPGPAPDTPAATVEVAELEVARLLAAAAATGATTVDRLALRRALQGDLARL